MDLCEFKANLIYMERSIPPSLCKETLYKNKNKMGKQQFNLSTLVLLWGNLKLWVQARFPTMRLLMAPQFRSKEGWKGWHCSQQLKLWFPFSL